MLLILQGLARKRMQIDPYSLPCTNLNPKYNKDLNIKLNTEHNKRESKEEHYMHHVWRQYSKQNTYLAGTTTNGTS